MISTEGKTHIKRYLAGYVPSIAQSIAVGIGNKAEAAGDTKLQFEVSRADIVLTSFDFTNNRLVFKAPVPEDFGGSIYEVAIYSTSVDEVAGEFGSQLLTTFDSDTEDWNNPTTLADSVFSTDGGRVGNDSLRQNPAAGGSVTDALTELFLDLSGHSNADKFVFAFNVRNAFVSSINFRFLTDSANYYTITLGAQTAGYKIVEAAKSTAVATGSPSWENITEMRVTTNSTAGGGGLVDFDAIRIDDVDTINQDYVMVARESLSTPFVKQEGKVQEVEFTLDVNV